MKQSIFTVEQNKCIAPNVYEMILGGDTSDITATGQFVNIKLDGFYLRRPISVCEVDGDTLTLIYKVVGDANHNDSEVAGPIEATIAKADASIKTPARIVFLLPILEAIIPTGI